SVHSKRTVGRGRPLGRGSAAGRARARAPARCTCEPEADQALIRRRPRFLHQHSPDRRPSMPATTSAPTPLQQQSVRAALRSPRRLRIEVLGGLVVALALIPEAISFSIIAGVDPRVGLFASFTMAVTIAIAGGRPAMISAATGSVALVIAPVSREYGLDYLIATVILA